MLRITNNVGANYFSNLSAQVLRVMIPNTPVVTYVQNRVVVFVHAAWNSVYAQTPALQVTTNHQLKFTSDH